MPAFVLLCGAPLVGKTRHYLRHYADDHVRVVADPATASVPGGPAAPSLHAATKLVLQHLRSGTNVVFEATDVAAPARAGLIRRLRAAVPAATVVGELLEPAGREEQAKWQRAWALAEGLPSAPPHSAQPAAPDITEGYDSLYLRRVPLQANNSPGAYAGAALLCDLPALLHGDGAAVGPPGEPLALRPEVATLFRAWVAADASRVVIVLLDGAEATLAAAAALASPSASAATASPPPLTHAQLVHKFALAVHALRLPFPVFFELSTAISRWQSLAALQYRHRLHLPACLLVTAAAVSSRGRRLATALGVPWLDGAVLLTQLRHAEGGAGPDQLQAIIDRTAEHSPDVPPHLRGVEYSWLPNPVLLQHGAAGAGEGPTEGPPLWHPILEPTLLPTAGACPVVVRRSALVPGTLAVPGDGLAFLHGAVVPPDLCDAFLHGRFIPQPGAGIAAVADPRGGWAAATLATPSALQGPDLGVEDPPEAGDRDSPGALLADPAPFMLREEGVMVAFFGAELWGRGRKYFKHAMVLPDSLRWDVRGPPSANVLGGPPPEEGWELSAVVRATDQKSTYAVLLAVDRHGRPIGAACGCLGPAPAAPAAKRCRHMAAVVWQCWEHTDQPAGEAAPPLAVEAPPAVSASVLPAVPAPVSMTVDTGGPRLGGPEVAERRVGQPPPPPAHPTHASYAGPADGGEGQAGSPPGRTLPPWRPKPKAKAKTAVPVVSHQPRRPRTSFQRFSAECRVAPSAGGIGARARAIAEQWRTLPAEQRQRYEEQYAADKREYARELEAFRERYPAEAAALAAKRRTVPATAAAPRRPRTAAAGAAGATELEPDPTGVTDSSFVWNEEQQRYDHLNSWEEEMDDTAAPAAPPPRPPPPPSSATYNSLVEAEAEEWLPPPPPHPGPPLPPPPARPARRVQFSSREQVLATPSPGRALAATTTRLPGPATEGGAASMAPLPPTPAVSAPLPADAGEAAPRRRREDSGDLLADVHELFFGPPAKKPRP